MQTVNDNAHDVATVSHSPVLFYLIVLSSVLIAAAGYIINDYFDLNIDQVNKPGKIVVDKLIKRRWAIVLHLLFSFTGIVISLYIGWRARSVIIPLGNTACVVLLWFYSTIFKKKLLIGNIIISLLTAWVILVLCLADWYDVTVAGYGEVKMQVDKILRIGFLYAGFAFIISLIREVVKDMEDIEGDARYGCRTMPIVWGIPVSKVFTAVWLVVLTAVLVIMQFYVAGFGWWVCIAYCCLLIIMPLLWILYRLYKAQTSKDYGRLSKIIKLVMFTGILSMVFFYYYR